MATARETFGRLVSLLSPEMQEALLIAARNVADDATLEQVNVALEAGELQEAMSLLGMSPSTIQTMFPWLTRREQQRRAVPSVRRPTSGNARLDYLIDLFTPEIRDAFYASVQDVKDRAIIGEMTRAIENGDPEAAFRALGFSEAAMRPLTQAIESAFERGGVLTGEQFPKYLRTPSGRSVFRFDVRNSRAEAWLRDHSGQLITRMTDETLTNVRNVMQQHMIDGDNPRTTALDIVGRIDPTTRKRTGGIVGLAANQERWVANTRRDLLELNERYFTRELRDKRFDRTVLKHIQDGKPIPREIVAKLVTAYENNALRYRGESIGRTEAIQALNRSEFEAHMQAIDMGALRKQDVRRHWDSAGDSRVRWSHKAMDRKYQAEGVGIDEPFVSPSGARMMFPGDTSLGAGGEEVIMCRCRVRLKVDFLAQWNDEDD